MRATYIPGPPADERRDHRVGVSAEGSPRARQWIWDRDNANFKLPMQRGWHHLICMSLSLSAQFGALLQCPRAPGKEIVNAAVLHRS